MITLITGAPGSGKTLYCVDKLLQSLVGTVVSGEDESGAVLQIERIIYSNISGLVLPHVLVDRVWLEALQVNRTVGCVVAYDEVQRVWPNRPTGSKKPPAVEYLETHRHDGIDLILLTQNPQLLDPAVRALVGRHLHVRKLAALPTALIYEWDACSSGLNFKNALKKTSYLYSRKAFNLYQSARLHTQQTRSLPSVLWIAVFGLVASFFLIPRFFVNLTERAKSTSVPSSALPASFNSAALAAPGERRYLSFPASAAPAAMSSSDYLDTLQPRYLGLPHTASRYDGITVPSTAPVPAACIASKSQGCICYSQTATRLIVPQTTCRNIVAHGLFVDFNLPMSMHASVSPSSMLQTDSPANEQRRVYLPSVSSAPVSVPDFSLPFSPYP
jgi:zona occludens toxin